MREAQKLVAQAASSEEYIGQSKMATEAIIAAFYGEVGWQVTVEWACPTARHLPRERQAFRRILQIPNAAPSRPNEHRVVDRMRLRRQRAISSSSPAEQANAAVLGSGSGSAGMRPGFTSSTVGNAVTLILIGVLAADETSTVMS